MLITFPYISSGELVDADRIAQRLRHFLDAVETFEDRSGQHHLRLLPVRALQFASHQQIELLVGPAELHVSFERDGVVSLHQRIQQLVHRNRLLILKAFVKVFALQKLRHRVLRGQPHKLVRAHRSEPAPVEIDDGLLRIENLEHLLLIRLGIQFDLLRRQRRPRRRAPRRVANHPRKIADQKNRGVPQVLKVLELAQHHRVS